MQTVAEPKLLLSQLQEKVNFYESIINHIPAIIFINEIEHGKGIASIKNLWLNKYGLDFAGFRTDEIAEMGYDFIKIIFHPDDIEIPRDFYKQSIQNEDFVHYGLSRHKPKNQEKYHWLYSRTKTINTFPDGSPKQFLNIAFDLHNELHTENQLVNLLQEINCLKHALKLKSLTRREIEVLKLIGKGSTDKVIATTLKISVATAKTHRNRILKKLGLKNSASVAAFARECGV